MENLWGVGLLAVCIGLAIYISTIRARKAAGDKKEGDAPPGHAQETAQAYVPVAALPAVGTPALPVREYVPGPALSREDNALYAAISAAIAGMLEAEGVNPEGGFAIRSVRPVHDAQTKPLTRKDGALYAILTAAIGMVLEAEGVDPEKGFRITDIKAL